LYDSGIAVEVLTPCWARLSNALVGAALAATVFAGYLLLRHGAGFSLHAFGEELLAVAASGALVAANAAGPIRQRRSACGVPSDRQPSSEAIHQDHKPEREADPAANTALAKTGALLAMARNKLERMNRDLDRLKESYRDLYHNAPVMYFSLDVEGRLVTFNDTLVRTLGYRREELAGRPYAELLAPAAVAERDKHVHLSPGPKHALPHELETLWLTKEGAVLDVWIRTVQVRDDQGNFVRFRSAALDLTERNRLAHELRSRGDELERTNARLRHINSELEDFTHVVSHDLKEPLRTLQIYSNILAEDFCGQLGPDGFQYVNHLIQASRRLGTLIDDLLTLSQAGRIKGALQVFNLSEALATARNDLAGLIRRKEATVLTEGSLPTVMGDQHRITQLLTNLVANGLKYNNNPAPRVVIGQVVDEPAPGVSENLDSSYAIIYVRDNGIGIDPQHHHKIFGIFRRLHQPEEYEGTGAGLAICQKIVHGHGGRIWVSSELSQGATFYFALPRPTLPMSGRNGTPPAKNAVPNRTLPAEDRQSHGPESRAASPTTDSSIKTPVLLVEDMVEVGLIIQRLGEKSGLNVTYCTNAEEAWEYLQNHEPELLLLDINLPGMSGIDLCKKVRGDLERGAVPIVLFSHVQTPEELKELHAVGANFVLSKDLLIDPAYWQKKMKEILPAARGLAQPR
jgi:PAS domain S-box-containing protein